MDGVGGNEQLRRANLTRVLTLLHQSGAQARSELTRRTGLNRSTIAGLVSDLVAAGLVQESFSAEPRSVGRPSPTVSTTQRHVAIALNPEIDAIGVAAVALGGHVLSRHRHEVPPGVTIDHALRVSGELIAAVTEALPDDCLVVGVGIALPGLVRQSDGLVRNAPHLGWTESAFATDLQQLCGLPVRIANDASAGARAERLFGAGRGVDDLVYLNGGASGIGGGIISAGAATRGADGHAGEFGHMIVPAEGRVGRLEDEVARSTLLEALGMAPTDEMTVEAALLASSDPGVLAEVDRQRTVLIGTILLVLCRTASLVLGAYLHKLNLAMMLFGVSSLVVTFGIDMHILHLLKLPVWRVALRSIALVLLTVALLTGVRWVLNTDAVQQRWQPFYEQYWPK